MKHPLFFISRDDWSLHRKGYLDHRRHQQKVKETIQKNIADLISEENIIMSEGKKRVKIPIRSIEEYKFRFNYNKGKHVGQGNGNSKVGDLVARDPNSKSHRKKDKMVGDQKGMDYYEADISLAELEEILFKDLELPNLKKKEKESLDSEDIRFNDIRKKGLQGNIDKKKTLLSSIKRKALSGKPTKLRITKDDLRFKTWDETIQPHSNAVVIAMMDTSGSMGLFEKYIARSFFFWMVRFLRTKYENLELVFIAHHTEAKEVDEESFFTKGESGGTICSSAYQKALEVIYRSYPKQQYNIFCFHFSDGDNLTSDNALCIQLINELVELSNLFGYGEVNQYQRTSTLMSVFKHVEHERFKHFVIKEKSQVYDALKFFF